MLILNMSKIYIGADHKGYKLKRKVSNWLVEWKYDFEDLGAEEYDKSDDYTIYAERVASMVADDKTFRGILMCGSGVGVDIMANKFDGVRASFGKSAAQVKAGRADDAMNVLILAASYTGEIEAKKMVKAFLETKFDNVARHKKRLDEIKRIEANN